MTSVDEPVISTSVPSENEEHQPSEPQISYSDYQYLLKMTKKNSKRLDEIELRLDEEKQRGDAEEDNFMEIAEQVEEESGCIIKYTLQ